MTSNKVEQIKAEFRMFVPEDDGSAMDWFENTLTQYHQDLMREVVEELEEMKENRKRCRACGKHTLDKSTGLGKEVFPFQCTACGNYQEETSVVNQTLTEAQTIIKSLPPHQVGCEVNNK